MIFNISGTFFDIFDSLSCIQPRPASLSQTLLDHEYRSSTNQGESLIASLDLLILFWGRKRAFLCAMLYQTIWPLGQKTDCRLFQLILCLYALLYIYNVMAIAHLESVFPEHLAIPMISRSPASVWVMLWTLTLEFRKETWIGILVVGEETLSYVFIFLLLM